MRRHAGGHGADPDGHAVLAEDAVLERLGVRAACAAGRERGERAHEPRARASASRRERDGRGMASMDTADG